MRKKGRKNEKLSIHTAYSILILISVNTVWKWIINKLLLLWWISEQNDFNLVWLAGINYCKQRRKQEKSIL